MTNYNSQVGPKGFKIQFETDDKSHYERVQQTIRDCIDGHPADANPIQSFLLKAQGAGTARQMEMRLMKAESEREELRAALANMQLMKEKYQTALIDVVAALERHGMVV